MIYLLPIIGAVLSRWCGGGITDLHKRIGISFLPELIFSVPFGYIAAQIVGPWGWLVVAFTLLGKQTGHGQWLDMGKMPLLKNREHRLSFLVDWLWFKVLRRPEKHKVSGTDVDSRSHSYWYDFLGMFITGIAVTISCGVVIMTHNILYGLAFILWGGSKAIAYDLGHRIGHRTGAQEYLSGLFHYIGIVLVWTGLIQ